MHTYRYTLRYTKDGKDILDSGTITGKNKEDVRNKLHDLHVLQSIPRQNVVTFTIKKA